MPQIAAPIEDLEKTLRDYALPQTDIALVIRRPAIYAKNFELKPITLQCGTSPILKQIPSTLIQSVCKQFQSGVEESS